MSFVTFTLGKWLCQQALHLSAWTKRVRLEHHRGIDVFTACVLSLFYPKIVTRATVRVVQ